MPANPLTDPNWATETTDKVVRVVDTVRDQTTTKVIYAARGLVFGLIAVILGFFALVIMLVGMMRGLQALLVRRVEARTVGARLRRSLVQPCPKYVTSSSSGRAPLA